MSLGKHVVNIVYVLICGEYSENIYSGEYSVCTYRKTYIVYVLICGVIRKTYIVVYVLICGVIRKTYIVYVLICGEYSVCKYVVNIVYVLICGDI